MEILILIILLLGALTIHEFAHAITAYKLGDGTPKMQGRVTLNPLAHLDPIGTVLLIVTVITGFGFGWGKPVTFNPANLKNPKRDIGLVAIAGPLSNILLSAIAIILILVLKNTAPFLIGTLITFIFVNWVLAIFNLIPIYPLDGYNFLLSILPDNLATEFAQTAKYGMILLLILIFSGATKIVINPFLGFLQNILIYILY